MLDELTFCTSAAATGGGAGTGTRDAADPVAATAAPAVPLAARAWDGYRVQDARHTSTKNTVLILDPRGSRYPSNNAHTDQLGRAESARRTEKASNSAMGKQVKSKQAKSKNKKKKVQTERSLWRLCRSLTPCGRRLFLITIDHIN